MNKLGQNYYTHMFGVPNLHCVGSFGLWVESRLHEENPQMQRKTIQTAYRKEKDPKLKPQSACFADW